MGQQHLPGLTLPGGGGLGKGVVFPQENGGVGHAEAVDALLHVAYHEDVFALPGHGGKNMILHVVAVLVLVHHDLPVPPRNVAGQLRGFVVFVQQQGNGKMLHVRKVHHVPPRLLLPVGPGEVRRQVHQGQHGRGHGLHIVDVLLLLDVKNGFDFFQFLLALVADVLGPLALRAAFRRPQFTENRHDARHGVPVPAQHSLHGPDGPGLLQELIAVGSLYRRGICHPLHSPLHLSGPVLRRHGHVRQHHLSVDAAGEAGDRRLPAPAHLLEPRLRPGMALDLGVEIHHQLLELPVVPALAQGAHQLLLPPVHVLVEPLQRVLQHVLLQHGGLLLVQRPEIRRIAASADGLQKMHVLPQQRRAEGVHRLDVRAVHPVELLPQVPVVGSGRHLVCQLPGDLAPQLGGGGLGIGNDEEVVHVAALPDAAQQPLHQHLGLAAAGGGGHQQLSAAVFHGGFLLVSQRYGHVLPPPFPSASPKMPCCPFSAYTALRHTARRSSTLPGRGSRCRHPYSSRKRRGPR